MIGYPMSGNTELLFLLSVLVSRLLFWLGTRTPPLLCIMMCCPILYFCLPAPPNSEAPS
ncbi:hypothetical protein BDZ91DRAFT_739509 [Kalaharituber pfeilii]|nr:hypothetical protein BDZ91DRAFT_739509 [Kalaharituber pfeilii]